MVTNINLSSPEETEKKSFSGKSALILSVAVLAVIAVSVLALNFLEGKYNAESQEMTLQINQEQNKINEGGLADVLDFEEKLTLLGEVAEDHGYWDALLKKMGVYLLPEVRLTEFSGKRNADGSGLIELSGVAANLDALSRELILLKSFPDIASLEFEGASENTGQGSQPAGISFSANMKVSKSAFQK
jgi:hypothetical protein